MSSKIKNGLISYTDKCNKGPLFSLDLAVQELSSFFHGIR